MRVTGSWTGSGCLLLRMRVAGLECEVFGERLLQALCVTRVTTLCVSSLEVCLAVSLDVCLDVWRVLRYGSLLW